MAVARAASRAGARIRDAGTMFDETPLAHQLIEGSMNLGASLAMLNLQSLWGRHVPPSGVDQGGWLRWFALFGNAVPSAFPLHTRASLCAYVSLVRCWSPVWPQQTADDRRQRRHGSTPSRAWCQRIAGRRRQSRRRAACPELGAAG